MFDIQEEHDHNDIIAFDPYFQIFCMQSYQRRSKT